jgi:two-component system sensor histidine kinase QseC
LRNLVLNSIRHNHPGGQVQITVWVDEALRPCVAVCDDGPGIPSQRLAQLGQRRFERLDETVADGFGIGLSIVQRVAQLHGATVERTSPQGQGGLRTTLIFEAQRDSD